VLMLARMGPALDRHRRMGPLSWPGSPLRRSAVGVGVGVAAMVMAWMVGGQGHRNLSARRKRQGGPMP
jgi:hypothetical protein